MIVPDPSIVLLHHAGGGASDWSEIVEALGATSRTLALDLPGHGARVFEDPLGSIEAMSSFVAATIRDRGVFPVVLVGHSLGGAVAVQMALDHPELAAGLALVSTAARLRVSAALLDLVREHFSELPQQMVAMGLAPSADSQVAARWLSAPWPASPAAALADFAACERFDVRVRLGELRVPAVVMVGEQDMMTPVKRARELAEGISGARLRVFPGTGHLLIWERPAEVAAEIASVVSQVRERGTP
jgi:pimeloyl-ACP methyl ester carboxylesterase